MTKTKYTIRFVSKDSSPQKDQIKTSCPGFPDFRNAIDKYLNESISVHPYFQYGLITTMFRASASLTGSINILPVDLVIDTRSKNTLSL
jgi:hypothetical protein